jgi:hypothetical protein
MRIRTLVVVGAVLVLPSVASAQRWGRERFPQSGACFFRDANFRGEYFCVGAGANVGAVPDDMNDQISSIRIFGRAEVIVFRDVRFGGNSSRFGSDVRNLKDAGWNDWISSMRVEPLDRGRDSRDSGDRRDDRRDDRRGDRRDDRRISNDDADKIIKRAYQDVLGRDPDQGGFGQYRSRIIDDGWTEAQVRESIRNSPEFRDRLRTAAQDVVRRAYLAVLNREPDAGGAEQYIQKVLRDNWKQQDVERDLRNSPEFRNRR